MGNETRISIGIDLLCFASNILFGDSNGSHTLPLETFQTLAKGDETRNNEVVTSSLLVHLSGMYVTTFRRVCLPIGTLALVDKNWNHSRLSRKKGN